MALELGQGEGECTQLIELTDGTSTQTWRPNDEHLCNAHLIGVHDGAWLIHATGLHGEFGSQYEGPGVLYELQTDGTGRSLTPTTLQSGWNAIGVLRNVQVIGS